MKPKHHGRKNARAILTSNERKFLINFKKGRPLTSSERHSMSSIANKTRKAFEDLNLIFEKHPQPYLLFSERDIPSLEKPIREVTKILYERNYRREFLKRLEQRSKHIINKKDINRKTRKRINEIVKSVLNELQSKP